MYYTSYSVVYVSSNGTKCFYVSDEEAWENEMEDEN